MGAKRIFGNLLATGVLLSGGVGLPARADAPKAEVFGTIVAIRGNILVVRPSLRPKLTRVSFGDKTALLTNERASRSVLKPGMRIGLGGAYSAQEGLHPFWIEATEKPLGYLAEKSTGLSIEGGRARAIGTLKSVEPFVFTDDTGKAYTGKLDRLFGVWHLFPTDRNGLLIGTRIRAEGTLAPDGVLQATTISPDQSFARQGTMFGKILAVHGDRLDIRPRYTSDTLTIHLTSNGTLLKQVSLDPDSIHVGDTVTFWGEQRNHPGDQPKSDDLKATALLIGPYRYPASAGQEGGVFLTGKIASLEPTVTLALPSGKVIPIIITAQMPIARLEPIHVRDLQPGRQAMFVLSRRSDGSFETSTVVLDASPYVGYGG